MRRKTGIFVAAPGRSLREEPLAYSTRNSHLIVDTSPAKNYLGIREETDWAQQTVNLASVESKETVFHSIEHHLRYVPKVSVLYLARQVPVEMVGFENNYGAFLYIGGVPWYEEIFTRVGYTHIEWVHRTVSVGGSAGTHPSVMQEGLYRVKYLIYLNEGLDEPYETVFVNS